MKYHCPLYIRMNYQVIETACSFMLNSTMPTSGITIASACSFLLKVSSFFPCHSQVNSNSGGGCTYVRLKVFQNALYAKFCCETITLLTIFFSCPSEVKRNRKHVRRKVFIEYTPIILCNIMFYCEY